MIKTAITFLLATTLAATAQDVLFLKKGDHRSGEIVSADATTVRLRIPLGDVHPKPRLFLEITNTQCADIDVKAG